MPRYGELRVRELEVVTSGQEVLVALDQLGTWSSENFEQAVVACRVPICLCPEFRICGSTMDRSHRHSCKDYTRVMSALAAVELGKGVVCSGSASQSSVSLALTATTSGASLPPGSRCCLLGCSPGWSTCRQTFRLYGLTPNNP